MHTSVVMTALSARPPETFKQIEEDENYIWAINQSSAPATTTTRDPLYRQMAFDAITPQQDHAQADGKEKSKKEKKWSIGKLFRRRKKSDESDLSSESDDVLNNRHKTKRKRHKKKKATTKVTNFDHIVVNQTRRAQSLVKPSKYSCLDDGVLSDPTVNKFIYKTRGVPQVPARDYRDDVTEKSYNISLDGSLKKTRKDRMKARAEAIRNSLIRDSSSEEESLKSNDSSTAIIKSDDSLLNGSWSKRSRGARTDRHIKRLSRDDEHLLNKEAELLQQGYTKAEVELLTRTPTSQSSGYGTCKRGKANTNPPKSLNIYSNDPKIHLLKSESLSSFPSTRSYPSTINFNAIVNNETVSYAVPFKAGNTRPSDIYENHSNIMNVTFPLGKLSHVNKKVREPPVPPPRDPHRKLTTPVAFNRKEEYSEINHTKGIVNNDFERVMRRSHDRNLRRPISNSVDHIQNFNNTHWNGDTKKKEQVRRPASISTETNLYANTSSWRAKPEIINSIYRPEPKPFNADFLYYADETPRSRRPISIQSCDSNGKEQPSEEKTRISHSTSQNIPLKSASEFWRRLDNQVKLQRHDPSHKAGSETEFLSNIRQSRNDVSRAKTENRLSELRVFDMPRSYDQTDNSFNTPKSHARHKSDSLVETSSSNYFVARKSPERRKSSNLDDALSELEAIYNSLGLGDEDLLDRAERRELMSPILNKKFDDCQYEDVNIPTKPRRIPVPRRSTLPDKLQDDMAYRRLRNKDTRLTKTNSTSQISYMLASPVFIPYASDDEKRSDISNKEPDIIQDDVVYRTIKQTNNRLKVLDPQPPFGIPLGPISPAPSSDYLHAIPELTKRSRFMPRKSPDIVSDDLAYRSLRKDRIDDIPQPKINNSILNDALYARDSPNNLKKKRAVRSLSANIFTMVEKEIDDALNMSKLATVQKTNSQKNFNSQPSGQLKCQYPKYKVKQRNNTVDLFVSESHPKTLEFLKDETCKTPNNMTKTLLGDNLKNASCKIKSPQPPIKPYKNEFQQVLTLLAQEAMDTSNKLGVALAEIDKTRKNKYTLPTNTDNVQNALCIDYSSLQKPETRVNLNSEKMKSTLNITGNTTAVSSLIEYNPLHKVDETLKSICNEDKLQIVEIERQKYETDPPKEENSCTKLDVDVCSSNLHSHNEPFDESKRMQTENENETKILSEKNNETNCVLQNDKSDIEPQDLSEYNSSEELGNIFKTDSKKANDTRCDLNSPKLVQDASQQLRKLSLDESEPKQSTSNSGNDFVEVPWRKRRPSAYNSDQKDDEDRAEAPPKSACWYTQPSSIILACTYSLLFTHNFADIDMLTILGILLAMISIIAMLLI